MLVSRVSGRLSDQGRSGRLECVGEWHAASREASMAEGTVAAYSRRAEHPRRDAARPQRRRRPRAGLAARAPQSAASASSRGSLCPAGRRRHRLRAEPAVVTRRSPRPTGHARVRAGHLVAAAADHPHPLGDTAATRGHPPTESPGDRPNAAPDRAQDRPGDLGVVGARGPVAAVDGRDPSQRARCAAVDRLRSRGQLPPNQP